MEPVTSSLQNPMTTMMMMMMMMMGVKIKLESFIAAS